MIRVSALALVMSASAAAYEATVVSGGGTVKGTVGTSASASTGTVPVTQDNATCGDSVPVQEVVVSGGKLANAVISIDGIETGAALKKAAAVLDQRHCIYSPHVLAMDKGAKLTAVNSDAIMHNTHSYLGGTRTVFNLAMPEEDQRIDIAMRRSGLVTVKCDAGHDWMNAYVHVFDHPYYAVTGADGSFSIPDLPAGTYTLKVWHEKLGEKTQEITVEAGGTVDVSFDL